jgi:DNA polymerase-3 subunit epsilon
VSGTVRIALLDTETTGLFAGRDCIIEIAVLLVEVERASGQVQRILERYEGLQDPGRPIPWEAMAVHGITDAMVRGQRIDAARVRCLLEGADLLVAHNSGFDKGFVAQVAPDAVRMRWACSCRGIPWRSLFPQAPNARLQDLAEVLRVPKGTAHRAMGDVETTLNLLSLPHPSNPTTLLGHLIERKLP